MAKRLALLADIHSNLPALKAVLVRLEQVNADEVAFAGDLVGYYPWPNEVVSAGKKIFDHAVMGNHDYSVLTGDFRGYNPIAAQADQLNVKAMRKESLNYLSSLKITDEFYFEGLKILMIHGSPDNPLFQYVYPEYADRLKADCDVLVLGHTHVQFVKKVRDFYVINPGSVGQPRDGNPLPALAVMDVKGNEFSFELIRVAYNVETTIKDTLDFGYPNFIAERLRFGV